MESDHDSFSVLCIDDNVLLIDALERRLALEPDFVALYRVEDFSRSVESVVRHHPTVVLLDIDLPGTVDAISILTGIMNEAPDTRVVVFTGFPTGELVTRSMSRGAWGFLSKGISGDQLVSAIRRVAKGEAVIELDD